MFVIISIYPVIHTHKKKKKKNLLKDFFFLKKHYFCSAFITINQNFFWKSHNSINYRDIFLLIFALFFFFFFATSNSNSLRSSRFLLRRCIFFFTFVNIFPLIIHNLSNQQLRKCCVYLINTYPK